MREQNMKILAGEVVKMQQMENDGLFRVINVDTVNKIIGDTSWCGVPKYKSQFKISRDTTTGLFKIYTSGVWISAQQKPSILVKMVIEDIEKNIKAAADVQKVGLNYIKNKKKGGVV